MQTNNNANPQALNGLNKFEQMLINAGIDITEPPTPTPTPAPTPAPTPEPPTYDMDEPLIEGFVKVEKTTITETENLSKEEIERIALIIKENNAQLKEISAKTSVFKKEENKIKAIQKELREYLITELNGRAFKTDKVDLSFRTNANVEINENLLDDQYCKSVADTNLVRAAIYDGLNVPGAKLVKKRSLVVK